jgi:hypothetical protein
VDLTDRLHDPAWWRDHMGARLRELVPDFDTIGPFAIPYTRLPRRLGTYAEEFPRWADVAEQTPETLLLRPKLGEAAVRALIEAAAHAVQVRRDTIAAGRVGAEAAVARLVGELDDFDREILAGQAWTLDPVSQHVLAERLGVNPVSVSRNLPRARARFAELVTDPARDSSGVSVDRVKAVLSQKDRFIRTSRTMWGLRRWGVTEYVNIAHAIGECIDAAGGKTAVATVFAELRARYPDVSEASIRTYLQTLEFVQGKGVVRRRTKADPWPALPPLSTIRGVFRSGMSNEIRVAHLVTTEVLRGSGQVLHEAVADALGVRPGEQRTFTSAHGPVTVNWKLASTSGVAIGSLRAHAQATGAVAGDTLVLVFKLYDATLEAVRIGADDTTDAQVHKLVGRAVRKPSAALAAALDDVSARGRRLGGPRSRR